MIYKIALLMAAAAIFASNGLAGDDRTINADVVKAHSDNANAISIAAPDALAASWNFKLPPDDGASGQFLATDGSGTSIWASVIPPGTDGPGASFARGRDDMAAEGYSALTSGAGHEFADFYDSQRYAIFADNSGDLRIVNKALGVGIDLTPQGHVFAPYFVAAGPGAVYAPTISVDLTSGDEVGLYSPGGFGSNTLGFITDRIERMRIDANGNVGIGTGAPARNLTIDADDPHLSMANAGVEQMIMRAGGALGQGSVLLDTFGANAGYRLRLNGVEAAQINQYYAQFSEVTGAASMRSDGNAVFAGAPAYSYQDDENTGTFRPAADTVAIATGGVERMRIDATGKVGIGTDAPGAALTIDGGVRSVSIGEVTPSYSGISFSDTLDINNYAILSDGSAIFISSVGDDLITFRQQGIDRMTIAPVTGYVGIWTTAPTEKLDVDSDAIRLRTPKTPASASATCDQGELAWDASYIYTCIATDTWKRAALSTW